MRFRIQPRDIDVREDDPFKYDLLGRKESVEVLTHIIGSIEGPCVLSVDAPWGSGKTTYLKIWAQHLRNQGFPVVSFNAWETDYSEDPFVAVSAELTQQLQPYTDESLKEKIESTIQVAGKVALRAVPGLIRVGTAGILDINPLLEKEIGQTLSSLAERRFQDYQNTRESVKDFRDSLQDIAISLFGGQQGRPLVIVIDELDRCRPSYAIELLEVIKHLFSVDRIVFVMAINRSELAHSVCAIYGNDFDADGYLRRFIDIDYRLPEPDRPAFIENTMNSLGFSNYVQRSGDNLSAEEYADAKKLLVAFLGSSQLSLRSIGQALHHFGLLYASLRSDRHTLGIAAAVALIMRALDSAMYRQFLSGVVQDADVADQIFEIPGIQRLRLENEGHIFEAAVIVAGFQVRNPRFGSRPAEESVLWSRHKKILEAEPNAGYGTPGYYSFRVDEFVTWLQRNNDFRSRLFHFNDAVQRLELLSNDLVQSTETNETH